MLPKKEGKKAGHVGHWSHLVLHREFVEPFTQRYLKLSPRSFPEWQVFSPNVENTDASLADCHSALQCHRPFSLYPPFSDLSGMVRGHHESHMVLV